MAYSDGSPTGRRIRGPRPSELHTALDEVLKNEPSPDWDISAMKYAYIDVMREIERPLPLSVLQVSEGEWTFRLGDMALSPTMIESLEAVRCFFSREPERSRRVLRLLCAQYLAHLEARELPPRKPAVWARLSYLISTNPVTKGKVRVPLYPVSAEALAGAPCSHRRGWPAGWSQPSTPGCGSREGFIAAHMALATGSCWGPQVQCGLQGTP